MRKFFTKKILMKWLPLVIIVFAWNNPFYSTSLKELEKASEEALASLAIVEELYLFAEAAGSVKLPLISGTFQGAANSLDRVVGYLSISTMAVVVNTMLLKITHYKLIVVVLFLLWVGTFIGMTGKMARKLLLIGLFLNPGLSVFTHAIHYIDKEVQITERGKMQSELEMMHKDFSKKEEARKKKHEARKKRHEQRKEDHQDKVSGETRREERRDRRDRGNQSDQISQQNLEPQASDTTNVASSEHDGLHLAEDFKLTKRAIKFAAKKVRTLVVNFFTSVLFMNIILPIGYLLVLYLMIKTAFGFNFPKNKVASELDLKP